MNPGERVERNDDTLIEILISLPPKSVCRFMCVSKRWMNIVENPFFLKSYSRRRQSCSGDRLLALFQKSASQALNSSMINYTRNSSTNMLTINCTSSGSRIKDIPKRFGRFINSSNGLILCSDDDNKCLHVGNPVTEKWVTLPPPPPLPRDNISPFEYMSVGLMCEENTSELRANYIVIRAHTRIARCQYMPIQNNTMQIQTYSSKTGGWALSTLVAPIQWRSEPPMVNGYGNWYGYEGIYMLCEPPVVANGVFHWFGFHSSIAVYDPNDNDDQNHLQLIQVPINGFANSNIGRSPDDILWLAKISNNNFRMEVWMLPKGEDGSYRRANTIPKEEWILMHNVDLSFTIDLHFISWNPIVVLLYDGKRLLLYNVASESITERVRYEGGCVSGAYYLSNMRPPFLESAFLSSYAL